MPLGMEVGFGPGDFVFDVDPANPRKKAHRPPPSFWPMSIVAKWLDGSLGTEVLDGVAAPYKRGTAPSFRFMCIVAK